MKELQTQLQKILDDPMNFLVQQAQDEGKILIGYTCSMVPEALLSVDGLVPLRVTAPGATSTEMADTYLSSVLCTYTRSLLEFAMDDRYDFLKGWVHTSRCDHLRRFYDNLRYTVKPDFNHILDVPRRVTDDAVAWMVEELSILTTALEKQFNIDMSREKILSAIESHNQFKTKLKTIGDMRKSHTPPFTGAQFHRLMMASQVAPKYLLTEIVNEFEKKAQSSDGVKDYRARFMVVGGSIHDPCYTETIESQGGLVVADRYSTGSFPNLAPIHVENDPLEALARHVLENSQNPRMFERNMDREKYILDLAKEYAVDGIIIESLKFCTLWNYEASPLVTSIREAGIPVLRLEREYSFSGEGQLRTRIQAFIESMGK